MSLILVGQDDPPYVRRVAVALGLLDQPFRQEPLSVFADAAAMAVINPLDRVPSLVLEDGEVLIDSAAILDWLDERVGPGRALLPGAGPERRRQLQIVVLATGTIDKVMAGADERLSRPEPQRWPAWLDRCRAQAERGLAARDEIAAAARDRCPWLGGERIGQADVPVACLMGYVRLADPALLAGDRHAALARLAAACEALPAFAATMPAAYVLPVDG
mgnify:CR=1 FL=1